MQTHTGGCHCGSVRFEVLAAENAELLDCDCSICIKYGYLHLIVPKTHFTLLQGQEALSNYTFGTRVAQHFFCKTCGVKSFYVPRSHPGSVSVNARCLDADMITSSTIKHFNGRNWEQAYAGLESP